MSKLTEAISALAEQVTTVKAAESQSEVTRRLARALTTLAQFTTLSQEDSAILVETLDSATLPDVITLTHWANQLAPKVLPGIDASEGQSIANRLRAVVESQMFEDDFPDEVNQARDLLSQWDAVKPKRSSSGSPGARGPRSSTGSGKLGFTLTATCLVDGCTYIGRDSTGLNSLRWAAMGHLQSKHGAPARPGKGDPVHASFTSAGELVIAGTTTEADGGGFRLATIGRVQVSASGLAEPGQSTTTEPSPEPSPEPSVTDSASDSAQVGASA